MVAVVLAGIVSVPAPWVMPPAQLMAVPVCSDSDPARLNVPELIVIGPAQLVRLLPEATPNVPPLRVKVLLEVALLELRSISELPAGMVTGMAPLMFSCTGLAIATSMLIVVPPSEI